MKAPRSTWNRVSKKPQKNKPVDSYLGVPVNIHSTLERRLWKSKTCCLKRPSRGLSIMFHIFARKDPKNFYLKGAHYNSSKMFNWRDCHFKLEESVVSSQAKTIRKRRQARSTELKSELFRPGSVQGNTHDCALLVELEWSNLVQSFWKAIRSCVSHFETVTSFDPAIDF